MRRVLAILVCCVFLTPPTRGDDPIFETDGETPASELGGLIFLRHGNQTTWSLGGVLLPRKVQVVTATPSGPVVARFVLPSAFQSPDRPPLPGSAPAFLRVEVPDPDAMLYVEGALVRGDGTVRQLQSPPLPPGEGCPVRLRAVFQVGDRILIQDKKVLIRAGEGAGVAFDGRGALSVPLRREETAALPRQKAD
jgi:uncharacterized protein (TIGR03000 family)